MKVHGQGIPLPTFAIVKKLVGHHKHATLDFSLCLSQIRLTLFQTMPPKYIQLNKEIRFQKTLHHTCEKLYRKHPVHSLRHLNDLYGKVPKEFELIQKPGPPNPAFFRHLYQTWWIQTR